MGICFVGVCSPPNMLDGTSEKLESLRLSLGQGASIVGTSPSTLSPFGPRNSLGCSSPSSRKCDLLMSIGC